ncbi:MAG: acyclic terpene utilization AtuA family protein [Gemmatimonadetes bacterium]|nr:acyclic terpene utilization AtuA family protein [Gemmatimonadota bacterium]
MALNGQLGYGFTVEAFREGLRRGPDVIGADGGSNDGGPFYLGHGTPMVSRRAVHRDLSLALPEAVRRGIPLIIGSAGTAGADPHVQWTREIIDQIAREQGLSFRMAVIRAELTRERVVTALREGRIRPVHDGIPPLTEATVARTHPIVGQMGTAPFLRALELGVAVILAGRACDSAIFASPALRGGYEPGLAYHMAKIAECGTHCSVQGIGADCLWVEMAEDHFTVEPLHREKHCTPVSTAAHTLYEQANPYLMYEPEGALDVSAARFEALDGRTVRVSGSRFIPRAGPATVKLEGASRVGYRTITVAGARDPVFIGCIDQVCEEVRALVAANLGDRIAADLWRLRFRQYGRNAILGEREPFCDRLPHELGVVIEVLAETQEIADAVCALARSTMLHCSYPGRKTTAGNLALPYSPADIPVGAAYEFSIYHLMEVADPASPFPVEVVYVEGASDG